MGNLRFVTIGFASASLAALVMSASCVGDTLAVEDGGQDATAGNDVVSIDTGTQDVTSSKDAGDAAVEAEAGPACDLSKPFGTPVPQVALNTSATDDAARISSTGLELFLERDDGALGKRIYRYTRTSLLAPWTIDGVQLPLLAGAGADGGAPFASSHLTLTSDGLTAYLSVFRGSPWNIYFSTRTAVGSPWAQAAPVSGIPSGNATDEMPWLNATGDRIYFMSSRSGQFRLWTANKIVNGFQTPTALGAIEPDEDRAPVLSTDELTMYFSAFEKAPDAGGATMNIYKATRATIGDSFTSPAYVTELNSAGNFDAPTWLRADGCEIYFTSNRVGGNFDVYSAVKPQ